MITLFFLNMLVIFIIQNDVIYLLRIEEENQSHYVYIKHIERLLNLNSYTRKDKKKQFCTYCRTKCDL